MTELVDRLVSASIAGGIFTAVALVICAAVPRLPARARALLYWLATARFVLGLLWPAPIELRVLPPAAEAPPAAVAAPTNFGDEAVSAPIVDSIAPAADRENTIETAPAPAAT